MVTRRYGGTLALAFAKMQGEGLRQVFCKSPDVAETEIRRGQ